MEAGLTSNIAERESRQIRILHELFAREVSQNLSVVLRARVRITLGEVQRQSWGAFLEGLRNPGCLCRMEIGEGKSLGLLGLSPEVAHAMVDLLLGGSGAASVRATRELTQLECQILTHYVPSIIQDLELQWRRFAPISIRAAGLETRTEFLPTTDPSIPVLSSRFEMDVNGVTGPLELALPMELASLLASSEGATADRGASAQPAMAELLSEALVECEVRLEGASIQLAEISKLHAGALMVLDIPVDQSAVLVMNNSVRLPGEVRSQGNRTVFLMRDL
jgi:flagellar motor switch protein FliM